MATLKGKLILGKAFTSGFFVFSFLTKSVKTKTYESRILTAV
jgi:hypothetical protein